MYVEAKCFIMLINLIFRASEKQIQLGRQRNRKCYVIKKIFFLFIIYLFLFSFIYLFNIIYLFLIILCSGMLEPPKKSGYSCVRIHIKQY